MLPIPTLPTPMPHPPTDPEDECNSLPSGTGCNNIKTNVINLTTGPNAGSAQNILQYTATRLDATGTGSWSQAAANPSVADIVSPASDTTAVSNFTSPGIYKFIFTNANGCADSVAITVAAANIVIPNIFTPNNDGKNDFFNIVGLDSFPRLTAFNIQPLGKRGLSSR